MADVADYAIYVSVGTAVAVVGGVVRIVWSLSRIEKGIRDDFNAEIDNCQRDNAKLVRESFDRGETLRHEFGETASALRTKIHEMETWNRDTFVRKDSFEMIIGRLEKSIEKMGDKIEDRIEKLADRMSKSD